MQLQNVIDLLNKYNISAKKIYGQNFLLDDHIVSQIADISNINKDSYIIEIGPGMGFLTKELAKRAKKLLCYEIDPDMVRVLNNELKDYCNIDILLKDFLKADVESDIKKYLDGSSDVILVSNLPYYITTPILLKVLEETTSIKHLTCMMQKEVAQRICGTPSTKDYNALSVLVQYYTKANIKINVPHNCFYPEPDVDSAVITMDYLENRIFVENEKYFKRFNRAIFAQRRKTLPNNLKSNMSINKETIEKVLNKNNISLTIRAEALSVEDIIKLSNDFYLETKDEN